MPQNALASGALSHADENLLLQLSRSGLLSAQQMDYTRRIAKSMAYPAPQVLRLLRMASDFDIARALASLYGLNYWLPDPVQVEPDALAQVPFAFARQHRMLPVRRQGGVLQIAVDDPGDHDAQQRLNRHVSGQVEFLVSARGALASAIEMAYHFASHPSAEELAYELARVGGDLDGGRLMRLALADAVERGASDVHFSPSGFALLLFYRIDGVLHLHHVLPNALHARVASAIKVESGMDIAESRRPQDGSFSLNVVGHAFDLRVSSMPTTHGENLVVRILSLRGDVLPLDQCGFWTEQVAQISSLMRAPDGMVLSTGPTGSGKTTTLYAGLRLVNALERNIMTIEDPVEYHVPLVRQVRLNEKAGMTFTAAIKGFLRQDPDVVLVGEIRDGETATMAVRASQTGHLVPATLHTNDALSSISRLRDLGVPAYLLSATLRGVIGQRLVRRLCMACRAPVGHGRYRAVGCERCGGTGYRGRLAVGEVLVVDDALRSLIDQQAGEAEMRSSLQARGFVPMRASTQRLVDVGVTDPEEVNRVFGELSP
jgi:type II secretory ATPase GspE/PulE/Tfp pilus assembly ATPase PilB-like protein